MKGSYTAKHRFQGKGVPEKSASPTYKKQNLGSVGQRKTMDGSGLAG